MMNPFRSFRDYRKQLKDNYAFLEKALEIVRGEFDTLTKEELDRLLDEGEQGTYPFEREIEGQRIEFVLDEWPAKDENGNYGYSINAYGVKTWLGIKPGVHFYKPRR